MAAGSWRELAERSADPGSTGRALDRIVQARPGVAGRLEDDPDLAAALVACIAASHSLTRLVEHDPAALDVLAALDHRAAADGRDPDALVGWKRRELLRIAARDLLGLAPLESTVAAISATAVDVLDAAAGLAEARHLAIVAMGKLGAAELNYASDVDLVLVGRTGDDGETRAARQLLAIVGRCWPADMTLRPEGRDGSLVRTVDGFSAHWDRWASPWEYQALLKARPVAGDAGLGAAFAAAAAERLWNRPFVAEDLRSIRAMKVRTEGLVAAGRDGEDEIKRGPGGIRDIEFSIQLLQLVHGQQDDALRTRSTLSSLAALTAGGYVDRGDADWLGWGYRFLRRVEHLIQLDGDRPDTAVPTAPAARHRLARLLGFRDRPRIDAGDDFTHELRACRASVRQIHERLYFRPLLEAFAGVTPLEPDVAAARLAAFGFADADRTRQAVVELTRGLTRSSMLMQQMLPLLLDWLSATPDPDAGLLGLRQLAGGATRSTQLAHAFRESPETARRLCTVIGTSTKLTGLLRRNPDLIDDLGAVAAFQPRVAADLAASARAAVALRGSPAERRRALHRFTDREGLLIGAHDVLGRADVADVGRALAQLAESALVIAVEQAAAQVPLAVVALGRLGGSELSYGSDLDLVVVHGGSGGDQVEAERATRAVVQFLEADTPAGRIYDIDLDLRPEGRNGAIARSLDSYLAYFDRWAHMWERQAMVRARVVAGDADLGASLLGGLEPYVWRGLTDDDRREMRRMKARIETERLPVGEDPAFHLKLGPGAMADVEFCTQLLQLDHGLRATGTIEALDRLAEVGALDLDDATRLIEAYRFCEATRNRWFLIKGSAADALPQDRGLIALARSLDTTAPELRDRYRRVTRRARRVIERRFYGASDR